MLCAYNRQPMPWSGYSILLYEKWEEYIQSISKTPIFCSLVIHKKTHIFFVCLCVFIFRFVSEWFSLSFFLGSKQRTVRGFYPISFCTDHFFCHLFSLQFRMRSIWTYICGACVTIDRTFFAHIAFSRPRSVVVIMSVA